MQQLSFTLIISAGTVNNDLLICLNQLINGVCVRSMNYSLSLVVNGHEILYMYLSHFLSVFKYYISM